MHTLWPSGFFYMKQFFTPTSRFNWSFQEAFMFDSYMNKINEEHKYQRYFNILNMYIQYSFSFVQTLIDME